MRIKLQGEKKQIFQQELCGQSKLLCVDSTYPNQTTERLSMFYLRSFIVMCFALCASAFAAGPINLSADGVAASGHDVVAYFSADKPTPGSKQFSATHKGAMYVFANAENLKTFTANPDKYVPQYGGYCAFAAAFGKQAPANPNNFKVVDGKLYLNLNDDVQKKWNADTNALIGKADALWAQSVAK
jgi:YHS domain-containing protein